MLGGQALVSVSGISVSSGSGLGGVVLECIGKDGSQLLPRRSGGVRTVKHLYSKVVPLCLCVCAFVQALEPSARGQLAERPFQAA